MRSQGVRGASREEGRGIGLRGGQPWMWCSEGLGEHVQSHGHKSQACVHVWQQG